MEEKAFRFCLLLCPQTFLVLWMDVNIAFSQRPGCSNLTCFLRSFQNAHKEKSVKLFFQVLFGNPNSETHETGNYTVLLNSVADVRKNPSL